MKDKQVPTQLSPCLRAIQVLTCMTRERRFPTGFRTCGRTVCTHHIFTDPAVLLLNLVYVVVLGLGEVVDESVSDSLNMTCLIEADHAQRKAGTTRSGVMMIITRHPCTLLSL